KEPIMWTLFYAMLSLVNRSHIMEALFLSVSVSITITILDLILAFPIAWKVVRTQFRGKNLVNAIIESPLAVPTAGLGFSVALFWGITPGITKPFGAIGLFSNVYLMLVLFHFTTTFSYAVRALSAILETIDPDYETAAIVCGASHFSAIRTVTLPMTRPGIATAAVLCLAKSFSDTGGVMAVLAALNTLQLNGTALIGTRKGEYRSATDPMLKEILLAELALVSVFMILIALFFLILSKILFLKINIKIRKVWPHWERKISSSRTSRISNGIAFSFLMFFVLIPSFFIFSFVLTSKTQTDINWGSLFRAMGLSIFIASAATFLNLVLGVPLAIWIHKRQDHFLGRFMDQLADIPYIVPSAALGFSISLFWPETIFVPEIVLVVLAHTSMTFPFIVRNVMGGLQTIDPSLEETARTLGARPFQAFSRVTFPIIWPSILAGAIMAFTRSIGETGATLAVSPDTTTAPKLIVDLIAENNYFYASLATILLIFFTSVAIFLTRVLQRTRK
ncbi:MAG: ABC transporter permease, partial [Promethearchaeota archaeon]